MEPKSPLDNKILAELEEKLSLYMKPIIVERGWRYYLNGRVKHVKEMDGNTIMGAVQGEEIYAVTLATDNFFYSACTCPYDSLCKHMAALFFAYCERAGWRPELSYESLVGRKPAPAPWQSAAWESAAGAAEPSHPGEEGSLEQWRSWFGEQHGETWKMCRHSLHHMQPVLSGLKGLSKTWPADRRRLHWMASILFVLEQTDKAIASVDSYNRYYQEVSYSRMAEPWIAHFHELVSERRNEYADERERLWTEGIADWLLRRATSGEKALVRWDSLYLQFSRTLSEHRAFRMKEKAALEKMLGKSEAADLGKAEATGLSKSEAADLGKAEATGLSKLETADLGKSEAADGGHPFVRIAYAQHRFHEEADEEAVAMLEGIAFAHTAAFAFHCARVRLEQHRWRDLECWMAYLAERLPERKTNDALHSFLLLCGLAADRQPDGRWEAYMIDLLPSSYATLSQHWLDHGRFRDWADLQLLLGIRPEELDVQTVREVTRQAPSALIPLYHQAIEESIRARNRQSYRIAVKQLQKLEKLYKSVEARERWNEFFGSLVRKHQRLRAFQEELEKGKMLT
ncbi:hypothetical protein ABEV74_21020 [Paenibacillus cisolokensis]|uniref:SWIM zinc finger family protein n=1 Tax=Paenibacillus cisolokensis TaxID=1658519 RepID=UPI003D2E408D